MLPPLFHGNWIDLILLVVFLFYVLEGVGRGFVLGFIDLFGFIFSFLTALKLYNLVGSFLVSYFSLSSGIANAVGFLLAGFTTEIIFSSLISFVYKRMYKQTLEKFPEEKLKNVITLNKAFGVIPALGEAIIFAAFILTLLIALPIQGFIKKNIVSSVIGGALVSKTQGIEKNLNSIFGEAVNETLTFLTINANPVSSDRVNLRFTQTEVHIDESAEQTMLNLINNERTKLGLKRLTFSFELRDLARVYATDMFARGFFSHYDPENRSPFDRMKLKNISFSAAGENLALAPNVQLAHQGLMNSPGHKANILSTDFGKVGIGVIDGGIYGEMFVQEYTD